jgi:hypothetical protein
MDVEAGLSSGSRSTHRFDIL